MQSRRVPYQAVLIITALSLAMTPEFALANFLTDLFRLGRTATREGIEHGAENAGRTADNGAETVANGTRRGRNNRTRQSTPAADTRPLTTDGVRRGILAEDPITKGTAGLFNDLDYLVASDDFVFLQTQGQSQSVAAMRRWLANGKSLFLAGVADSGVTQLILELVKQGRSGQFRMANGKAPRVVSLTPTHENMMSRSTFRQHGVDVLKKQLDNGDPDSPVIVVIDGIEDMLIDPEKSKQGISGIATYMEEIEHGLAPREIHYIISGTSTQGDKIKNLPIVGGRFERVEVERLNDLDLTKMLQEFAARLETESGVHIPDSLQKQIIGWAKMYLPEKPLVSAVLDLARMAVGTKKDRLLKPESDILDALYNQRQALMDKQKQLRTAIANNEEGAAFALLENHRLPQQLRATNRLIRNEERRVQRIRDLQPNYERLTAQADELNTEYNALVARAEAGEAVDTARMQELARLAAPINRELNRIRHEVNELTENDVAYYISFLRRIDINEIINPESAMSPEQAMAYFDQMIFGQPQLRAIAQEIVDAVYLNNGQKVDRILNTYLLLGPTGTGKTEFARVINKIIHGKPESQMIRVDMGTMKSKESVAYMIGSPPGYIGYLEGGKLVKMIVADSDRVLVFDEIEKAAPEVMDLLLGMLDTSELVGLNGQVARFRNTQVIMTSNLIQEPGLTQEQARRMLIEGVPTVDGGVYRFRPEILGRTPVVVVTDNLNDAALKEVGYKFLRQQNSAVFENRRIQVEIDKDAMNGMITIFEGPKYGRMGNGRMFQTAVQQEIFNKVNAVRARGSFMDEFGRVVTLDQPIRPGDLVRVHWDDSEGLLFRTVTREEAELRIRQIQRLATQEEVDALTHAMDQANLERIRAIPRGTQSPTSATRAQPAAAPATPPSAPAQAAPLEEGVSFDITIPIDQPPLNN